VNETEDAVIRRVKPALDEPLRSMVEVRNQARVDLWRQRWNWRCALRRARPVMILACRMQIIECAGRRLARARAAVIREPGCLGAPVESLHVATRSDV
jgi:hypothetical protein